MRLTHLWPLALLTFAFAGTAQAQLFWDPGATTDITTGTTAPFQASEAGNTVRQILPDLVQTQAPPPGVTEGGQGATPPPVVDESALRYFASRGDTRRLEIEIARLRALYPNWRPPEDPLSVPVNVDEQLEEMWRLYAENRLAEARRLIAERREGEPGWQAPADLLERLALSEARERIVNASELDQFDTVIRVGSENPHLLTCSEVDVLWRVAEAFARTGRQARARDAYRYILANCETPGERLATMQNATQLLDRTYVDELLALERFDEAGEGEFATIRDDLARDAVARGGEDATLTVDNEALTRLERLARAQELEADARLLGWYYLRRENFGDARSWFALAMEREPSPEAAQGLALALVGLANYAAAEEIAYPYRDASDDNRDVYLAAAANLLGVEPRVALDAEVLARIVAEAAASRDVATARQLGWYARAYEQHDTAAQWFSLALSWDRDDEPSAYGLALTRLEREDNAGLAEIKRLWAGRSERIVAVGTPAAQASAQDQPVPTPGTAPEQAAREETTAAPRRTEPAQPQQAASVRQAMPRQAAPAATAQARRSCRDSVPVASLSPQAALDHGWCLMDLNRPHEAAQAFERALQSPADAVRRDASYGQSLAYLRLGLANEAAVAATRAPQNAERSTELQASILAERALGFYERGRYVETLIALDQRRQISAERIDLMVLRGYSYLNMGRRGDALRIFQAAAGTGDREAIRGLAAAQEAGRQ